MKYGAAAASQLVPKGSQAQMELHRRKGQQKQEGQTQDGENRRRGGFAMSLHSSSFSFAESCMGYVKQELSAKIFSIAGRHCASAEA